MSLRKMRFQKLIPSGNAIYDSDEVKSANYFTSTARVWAPPDEDWKKTYGTKEIYRAPKLCVCAMFSVAFLRSCPSIESRGEIVHSGFLLTRRLIVMQVSELRVGW